MPTPRPSNLAGSGERRSSALAQLCQSGKAHGRLDIPTAVAGIGAASGLGAYVLAAGATVLLFFVVGAIGWLARRANGDG